MKRPTRVTASVAFLLIATAGLASAQTASPTVSTTVTAGSRQLSVTDLAGNQLSAVSLTPGVPNSFRVTVRDTDYTATRGFSVQSTLNNLYRDTGSGYDYATKIPSSRVSVSYATSPLAVLGPSVDLNPDYLLSGTGITCSSVTTILGTINALTDPLCVFLNGLTGTSLSFADVALDATAIPDIDLASLAPSSLPVPISAGGDRGAYTNPDCAAGIGAGDTSCSGTATARTYLTGGATGALSSDLTTLLTGKTSSGPLSSADGSGAVATANAVIQALQSSADSNVSEFGNRLTLYTADQQVALVNGLLQKALDTIQAADLANLTGNYHGFPRLTVDPTGTAPGRYAGTLTVTLVE